MPLSFGTIVSALAALVVVLGLVLLAARGARSAGLTRLGPPRGTQGRRLTLQDTLALDRTRRLLVVRCDGRDFVLLTGGSADLFVAWLPGPDGGRA